MVGVEYQTEKPFFVAVTRHLRLDIKEGADLRYGSTVFEDFYQPILFYDSNSVCSVRRVREEDGVITERREVEAREGGFGSDLRDSAGREWSGD